MPPRSRSPRTISSFRCCTECAPICSGASSRMATASASTFPTARTGFPTSCGAWPSAQPTSASSSAISYVSRHASALLLPADSDAISQREQYGVKLLRCVNEPVEFLNALRVNVVRSRWPRRLSRPQRIIGDEQAATAQLGQRDAQGGRVLVLVDVVKD